MGTSSCSDKAENKFESLWNKIPLDRCGALLGSRLTKDQNMHALPSKNCLIAGFLTAACSFGVLALLPLPAAGQSSQATASAAAAASKPTPRTPDGHPDFSGFYNLVDIYHGDPKEEKPGQHVVNRAENGSVFFDYGGANGGGGEEGNTRIRQTQNGKVNMLDRTCISCEEPPYKPEYMAKVKAIGDAMYGDASPLDPQYDCKPYGVPRGSLRGGGGYAMQIVQNKDVIAFLYEDRPGPYFRIIYMDGRGHPEDFDPSYVGHSIGHWEGDTLVVDVVGLNDETWLGSGTVGPKYAMMHSDKMHVVERWTRTGNVITYEATVDDPVMFTKPWVMTPRQTQLAAPDDYIRPTTCIPLDKNHLMKHDNTPYNPTTAQTADNTDTAANVTPANMVGSWNVTIHSTIEGILTEQWTLTQDGAKITGGVKSKSGEATLEGSLNGAIFLGAITDGDKKYAVRGTAVDNDFDGTIRMGKNEFLLSAKRSK